MKFQNEEVSCGAAALVNALRFHRVHDITEEQVQDYAGTNWDGTSDGGLKRAAKKLGWKLHGVQHLCDVWLPTILLVDGGGHWVAVARLSQGGVVVVDSAAGVGMTQRYLCQVYTDEELLARARYGTGKIYGLVLSRA